ncbi:MAG: GNAT family N-acetyltransferase [Candidatus Marinimicrobia bacterium]|nr:GNAT family N-acetyltransferase [Candidatus Neomarinimicrobiota bacterium]MCF7840467.1 GNAT family N-acetyltransferase [Candidatus Neomarinimicrobiota bacterium]
MDLVKKPPLLFDSKRVNFRELCDADLDPLAEIYADPVTMQFIGDGTAKTREYVREELDKIYNRYAKNGYSVWATELKSTGELIGRSGLLDWTLNEEQHVEVAYLLAGSFWRQGLGTEIARTIRDYAFRHLDVDHLISLMYPDNTGSVRVAEKNGMSLAGTVTLFKQEVLMYRIERSQWESIQKMGSE